MGLIPERVRGIPSQPPTSSLKPGKFALWREGVHFFAVQFKQGGASSNFVREAGSSLLEAQRSGIVWNGFSASASLLRRGEFLRHSSVEVKVFRNITEKLAEEPVVRVGPTAFPCLANPIHYLSKEMALFVEHSADILFSRALVLPDPVVLQIVCGDICRDVPLEFGERYRKYADKNPYLRVTKPGRAAARFDLNDLEHVWIGDGKTNNISVPHAKVSLKISLQDSGDYRICGTGGAMAVLVNDDRLPPHQSYDLQPNDTIWIGSVSIEFKVGKS